MTQGAWPTWPFTRLMLPGIGPSRKLEIIMDLAEKILATCLVTVAVCCTAALVLITVSLFVEALS